MIGLISFSFWLSLIILTGSILLFLATKGWLWKIFIAIGFIAISFSVGNSPFHWIWPIAGLVLVVIAFKLDNERLFRFILNILVVATALVCIITLANAFFYPHKDTKKEAHPNTITASLEDTIRDDMAKNGGGEEDNQWVMGDKVDPKIDKSSTGSSAFNKDGIRTPAAMVSWLKEGTDRGLAAIAAIKEKTEALDNQIFDVSNWRVIQALVDGKLTDNTGFIDGKKINVGLRDIKKGDIFLVFVNPNNHKLIYFRGACANPQGFTPQLPVAKNPTKTKLELKVPSQDPAPRGNAPEGKDRNDKSTPGKNTTPEETKQPPNTPREEPKKPAAPDKPPVGSKPDPTPAPAPEPSAPTPDNHPSRGESPPPGM